MPLEPDSLLQNRYRIQRVLGQGGMGAVYLATDESLGLPVAVKENLNVSPESERQFKREATLLATLRHHHLPRVTNHFILGGQQYLVMDFVEGEDLKQRLARLGPLPVDDVLRWGGQICDALSYLHGLTPPVIHRDIKPANIRLNAAGEAMLVDFGIAKATPSGQKTTTSAVAYTPGFAPPEQYGMARTGPRTDQYALAATLYNLLTGEAPPDSMDRLLGHVPLPPPEQARPEVPPHVSLALQRALAVKAEERFDSVAAFKAGLLGQVPVTLPAPARPPTPTPTPGPVEAAARRPGWLVPAGIGGVLVVAALVYGLMGFPGLAPTPTPTPTATREPSSTPEPPSATPTQAPSATPEPPSATPTQAPSATPEPPTVVPTVAPSPTETAPPVGGGGRIAFISNRDGQRFQIYTMLPDGSDVQQLTFDDRDKWSPAWQLGRLGPLPGSQLAWSPDGAQLLYVAEGAPGQGLDLWVINADGSNSINLTAAARAGQATGDDLLPAWCSTGWIAFTSTRVNNTPQIFMMTLEDRSPRNFSSVHANPIEYGLTWFPDCQRFLLISTQNGVAELWRVFPFKQALASLWSVFPPADQQSYRVFLSDKAGYNAAVEDAALAPDGQYVAYTRQAPDGNEIILTTVSDSQLTMQIQQLTTTRSNSMPQWSPDGRYIVFVSKRDQGNVEVYRMDANGANQVNLSNNAAIDISPAWQP